MLKLHRPAILALVTLRQTEPDGWRDARAHLQVADPWDAYDLFPGRQASVRVVDRQSARSADQPELLLVELTKPVVWSGDHYAHLTVADRSGEAITSTRGLGVAVVVTCRGITEDRAEDWVAAHDAWRGGLAILGDLRLEPDDRGHFRSS